MNRNTGSATSTDEFTPIHSWLGLASKYGLAGVVIFLSSGLIYLMWSFVANNVSSEVIFISRNTTELINLQKQTLEVLKDIKRSNEDILKNNTE